MSIDKKIGQRIKALRQKKGLSQEELAAKMGYKSRSSINKIELGINDITQTIIKKLAIALDTTPGYILGWVDEPGESTEDSKVKQDETQEPLTQDERQLLKLYNTLNDIGKENALERLEEMTAIKRFTEKLTPPEDEEIYRAASSSDNHPAEITKLTKEEQERIAKATRMTPENSDL